MAFFPSQSRWTYLLVCPIRIHSQFCVSDFLNLEWSENVRVYGHCSSEIPDWIWVCQTYCSHILADQIICVMEPCLFIFFEILVVPYPVISTHILVGGDWNMTFIFPFSWESSSQLTFIFFRWGETTNQNDICVKSRARKSTAHHPYSKAVIWGILHVQANPYDVGINVAWMLSVIWSIV